LTGKLNSKQNKQKKVCKIYNDNSAHFFRRFIFFQHASKLVYSVLLLRGRNCTEATEITSIFDQCFMRIWILAFFCMLYLVPICMHIWIL